MNAADSPMFCRAAANTLVEIFDQLAAAAWRTLRSLAAGVNVEAHFDAMRLLLQAAPLSTAEYALAVQRLANAHAYWLQGEQGAAGFEIKLLARSLTRWPPGPRCFRAHCTLGSRATPCAAGLPMVPFFRKEDHE